MRYYHGYSWGEREKGTKCHKTGGGRQGALISSLTSLLLSIFIYYFSLLVRFNKFNDPFLFKYIIFFIFLYNFHLR